MHCSVTTIIYHSVGVAIKLNEGSTSHCAGCLKNKIIARKLCIVLNVKFVPRDCYFAVDRKLYFCAVAQCLKKKTRSSNLRCKPEKVEVDRTIDDSMKQLLKARNIPLFISSMAIETLGKVVKCIQILQNIIKF